MDTVTIPREEYERLKRQAKANRPLLEDLKEAFESAKKEGLTEA